MLGPVVEVLGQAIGGTDVREIGHLAHRRQVLIEDTRSWVVDCQLVIGIQGVIAYRRFKRLVVNRERPFGHPLAGKEPGSAFRLHDEGTHAARRICVELVVGYSGALPGLAYPAYHATAG